MSSNVSPAEQRVYVLQYRLFNRAEGNHLLEEAGFSGITFFDGYTDTPLDDHNPTMVIRAQKPG